MRGPSVSLQKSAAIGDQRYRPARQLRIGAQHFRRMMRLKFQIVVRIDNARDHFFHVVGSR